jgi:hypothetical protein
MFKRPTRPPIWLVGAAAGGLVLWAVVALTFWTKDGGDGLAYWLAGQRLVAGLPLYDMHATSVTPFAYWYPPVLAQVLAPFTAFVPQPVFVWGWLALTVTALWQLVERRLALLAAAPLFLPIALELWFRNVHLLIALVVVLGLRGRWWLLALGAVVKLAPGVAAVYLFAAGRRREALLVIALGLVICAASALLAPDAWRGWIDVMVGRDAAAGGAGILPIPYVVRLGAAIAVAAWAGRRGGPWADSWCALAVVIALPTWFPTAFSALIAVWTLRPVKRSDLSVGGRLGFGRAQPA